MHLRSLALAGLSLIALSAAPALAEGRGHEACKGDVERFCKDMKPGGGRIIQCLKQHESELSNECKAVGAEMKAKHEAVKAACETDINTYCKDMPKGHGAVLICLKSNQDRISAQCKSEVASIPLKKHKGRRAHAG